VTDEPGDEISKIDLSRIVSLADFERLAAKLLPQPEFDYIAGGSDDEQSLARNAGAFARWQLVPAVLRDVSAVDISTTFLDGDVRMPVGIAPVAFQHFAHPEAEIATARAAADAGVLFCLSTMSSRSLEDVASASGTGRRWFQLYVHRNRTRSEDLVRRAASAGYEAIVVTVDFPVPGNRERDKRNRLTYPQVFGNFDASADLEAELDATQNVNAVIGGFNDPSFSWRDLAWLLDVTTLPVLIKGILSAEDARLAVDHGAAGVIVSNHGGRQLDRSPAALEQLPDVVDAVNGRAEIYVDGGVRRGTDVLTAMALGARGVFIGRPAVFGLAVAGEAGVRRALALLEVELLTDMALLGTPRVADLDAGYLRRA